MLETETDHWYNSTYKNLFNLAPKATLLMQHVCVRVLISTKCTEKQNMAGLIFLVILDQSKSVKNCVQKV